MRRHETHLDDGSVDRLRSIVPRLDRYQPYRSTTHRDESHRLCLLVIRYQLATDDHNPKKEEEEIGMTRQNMGKKTAIAVFGTPTLLLAAICAGIWLLAGQIPPAELLLFLGLGVIFTFVVLVG